MLDELRRLSEKKLVNWQAHPSAPITIWNYSAKCQYDRAWNDVLMSARGLILDAHGNVVARGFRKFFNLSEHTEALPTTPFKVFDKVDGSLGILYFVDGVPAIATRGSFTSDQALRATDIFREHYAGYVPPAGMTAVFEIIYPQNRVVVDYGRTADLFHLGLVDNATGLVGRDLDANWPGPKTLEFEPMPPAELAKAIRANAEGFVVRYACGFQVKVKLAEYVRVHRNMFQTSTRSIWERLAAGDTVEQIYEGMPDEVMPFVREHAEELQRQFRALEFLYQTAFASNSVPGQSRKEFAVKAMAYKCPSILFAMLDGKPYAPIIWKAIEPAWIPARAMTSEDAA